MLFELETGLQILLIVCLIAACGFEFVNGFHDTANAVATVIYTNSLRPWVAVVWSGICNFAGVLMGGIGVAMGIVNLLPIETLIDQNIYHSIAMIMALLLSAIIWNLGTWYYGLPSSSSHTLIGSILGVGLAFSFIGGTPGAGVNWEKAGEIGLSLIVSPLFGFVSTILLMFILSKVVKSPKVFSEPPRDEPPPMGIRVVLIATSTLVSFFHGSNDGQKGVGLVMLILIGIVPAYFALNLDLDTRPETLRAPLAQIEQVTKTLDPGTLSASELKHLQTAQGKMAQLNEIFTQAVPSKPLPSGKRFDVRAHILVISKELTKLSKESETMSDEQKTILTSNIKKFKAYTDYSPEWVLIMISLSLGLGTMIGWKRIVKTVGEKIGKQHLTYAQGASAELVAASTIGLSTAFGLPVSTTHVLSSGIAGSMVASKGLDNLQGKTIKNIAMAWLLTLPVSVMLSATLFLLFRAIL